MSDSSAIDSAFLKDLFKIGLDKGAIGGLILLAGFYFSKLVERYKFAQAIVQEQQKILYPQALKILDAADEFEELVNKKLGEIDGDISKVANLLRQVVAQHGPEIELDEQTAKEALAQTRPWSRRQIIDLPICSGKSLRNLLLEAVDDLELKNCILRMSERKSWSNPYLPSGKPSIVVSPNPYLPDVDHAREKLVTTLRNLKRSFLPAPEGVPPVIQHRLPVNDLMVGLVLLYLHELIQPHISQVLTSYQRLLSKIAEIPLIHWSASENHDVNEFLFKDAEFTPLSNVRAVLAGNLEAYVPHEYLAQLPGPTLSPFDLLHTRIRLAIRRMLLPGHRYQ